MVQSRELTCGKPCVGLTRRGGDEGATEGDTVPVRLGANRYRRVHGPPLPARPLPARRYRPPLTSRMAPVT